LSVAVEEEDAQMLVLGSCHRGPLGRTLAGSVGESLMHGAPCAVAVAPRGYGAGGQPSLLHFGVAYDGSDEARIALETAVALARRCRGEVTVLTVADYPHYGYATAWSVLSAGEMVDAERQAKQAILDEALAAIPSDVRADGRLLTGSPGIQLSDGSGAFDLLVVGSRAYGGVRRTLLGSTTRKVIHSASCPVLVMPRGTGAESVEPPQAESSAAPA
jgi:nucleotide-binding universal stress UspA family protein